ncbi:MAG: hypothetical protein ACE37F_06800 [Nannocystaceae bacterium]|nr:hypothetical protein [bacterium]
MTKPLALIFSLCALALGGCDSSSDTDDSLSSTRTGNGCTHSKGYWRTFNKYGVGDAYKPWRDEANAYAWFDWDEDSPALHADVDDLQCPERGSYYDVLMSAPNGDRWTLLAHKYIVAKLNLTSGAATGQAWDLVIEARDMLGDCQIDASEWEDSLDLAADLHAYNSGEWGPGACEE